MVARSAFSDQKQAQLLHRRHRSPRGLVSDRGPCATLQAQLDLDLRSYRQSRSLQGVLRFLSDRHFGESMWKANCTEQRSLMPLLHFWVVSFTGPVATELRQQLQCFRELCERLYLLEALRWSRDSSLLPSFALAQERHHRSFGIAWGAKAMRPKHHYCRHQEEQFRQHGMVIDTLAMGHRHQLYKDLAHAKIQQPRAWKEVSWQ